jgi:hypothetical protein
MLHINLPYNRWLVCFFFAYPIVEFMNVPRQGKGISLKTLSILIERSIYWKMIDEWKLVSRISIGNDDGSERA